MYILEIFLKRRKFTQIFEKSWIVIGNNISLAQDSEDEQESQLELYYFVSMVYSTVLHVAEAAGMSTSAAHYLARIQVKKSNIDETIVAAAQEIFAAPDEAKILAYADFLNPRIEAIVAAAVKSETGPDQTETLNAVNEIYQYFRQSEFSAAELFKVD